MMRSESRTDETSGLVTMMAASAWRIASVAPRSMPAGLSQMIQSNLVRSSRDDGGDAVLGQRVLVAGLRRRQQIKRLQALVADQRLRQLGDAVDDADQIEHDAALGPEHQIEIAQTDVEVDDDDLVALMGEGSAQRSRRRRLSDTTLARSHDQT